MWLQYFVSFHIKCDFNTLFHFISNATSILCFISYQLRLHYFVSFHNRCDFITSYQMRLHYFVSFHNRCDFITSYQMRLQYFVSIHNRCDFNTLFHFIIDVISLLHIKCDFITLFHFIIDATSLLHIKCDFITLFHFIIDISLLSFNSYQISIKYSILYSKLIIMLQSPVRVILLILLKCFSDDITLIVDNWPYVKLLIHKSLHYLIILLFLSS
jgi:hypothetical protein